MNQPVSIIGGNIAGLSAAYHLSRRGCPVTVYERKIWDKPCGGAISIEFANYLRHEMGLDLPATKQPVPGVRFCFAKERCVETQSLFVIVSRRDLQQQLVESLRKKPNIQIIFKRVYPENSSAFSPQTVLATGCSGFTRRIIGEQWNQMEYALAVKNQGEYQASPGNPLHLMFFDSRLKGYGWIFDCGQRLCNAGFGALIKNHKTFHNHLSIIKKMGKLIHCEIKVISPPRAWKIPILLDYWKRPVAFYKNNIQYIGVGDVLGLAHPVIAAGIEPAWQSGWLLGASYDHATLSIDVAQYRRLLIKNLRLTSRKPFDFLVASALRIDAIPFKNQISFLLMKLFHKTIIGQIKKYPWFAMVHDGNKRIDIKFKAKT